MPPMSTPDAYAYTTGFLSRSPEQTRQLGVRLGAALQAGDVVCLQGDLGAGKTTFVQGVALGWGSQDAVSSPTFIIVNEYRRGDEARLFHMDAYRLDSTPEAEELDLDTMLDEGALLIEWPERIDGLIPSEHLWIHFVHVNEAERELKFRPMGRRYEDLLDGLAPSIPGGN